MMWLLKSRFEVSLVGSRLKQLDLVMRHPPGPGFAALEQCCVSHAGGQSLRFDLVSSTQ